jgi:diadenosine tetraphosphatase ApaH/serine/threonine PP2A family protein phosphatase
LRALVNNGKQLRIVANPQEIAGVKALISDIHANQEALQAVLKDIAAQGVKDIYCLGDIIGYGPNPRECVDLVMTSRVALMGNHDQGAIFDPAGFNPAAERAIMWTRAQLEVPQPNRNQRDRRWDFLGELLRSHKEDDRLFVHGSPRNPINEYVFPEDVYNQAKMKRLFSLFDRYCFVGHTHVPGIFTEAMEFLAPDEIDHTYRLEGGKVLCNVGSVGQPRDGDWRACYVLLDGDTIRFRRVEYEVAATVQKIRDTPELDNFLAERLSTGK